MIMRTGYERLAKIIPFRRLLPAGMRERLTSAVYDRHIRQMPDRLHLQQTLIPLLAERQARQVLFVGVRSYTRPYAQLFAQQGMTLWTCDIDPVVARHGAPSRHRTLDICKVNPGDFPVQFDAIVLSGVVGWGVNEPDQINGLATRLHALLGDGRTLVLGWNTDRSIDPLVLPAWQNGFEALNHPAIPNRTSFARSTHVFDLLRTCKPVRTLTAFFALCMTKLCHERVQAVSETVI